MEIQVRSSDTLFRRTCAFFQLVVQPALRWALLGLAALFADVVQPAGAAVTEAWVHRYSNVVSNANDEALKIVRDAAGDILVTGTTDDNITRTDILTIKYSGTNGSAIWLKRYNGLANGDDYPTALAVDGSGNVVITGYSGNISGNNDYYTAKYAAANGALLWEKRYNGPANGDDMANAVAVDGSGDIVVTGVSYSANRADYYTAKYAATDGTLLWEKRYNGPANSHDRASAVAVDGSGNVVVTGYSGGDYYTAKYAAADGALLWEKRYNGPGGGEDQAQAVAVDGSGNVVVTGYSGGGYYTAKYAAADGTLLWEKRYNGPANGGDVPSALAVDASGNVVVTGWSGSGGFSSDYYTAKYAAADGALLWEQRYHGPGRGEDQAQAVAVDGSGNVVVTGWSFSDTPNSFRDYYTAKYAAMDGALLWEQRYNDPADSSDEVHGVTVDGRGDVIVTGRAENGSDSDYYTAKYAAADGVLLWERRYNGPANNVDRASAVAVDHSGNVIVTGRSVGSEEASDYYTAKYAPADGALVWQRRYHAPGNGDAVATAIAVDANANVVVTGYSDSDYYTAKYAAADGTMLWEKRYNGPANSGDVAKAVAIDSSDNVIVTGSSNNGAPNFDDDFYTAKYAAANGALLWERRYNGPANSSDRANAVAVDASGNVVVTGASASGCHPEYGCGYPVYDYYTAKYAAADGALLWEKRYNGPANRDDVPNSVAVDASGNVVVTGYSYKTPVNEDYYTAKYAAADGALLWEKRYDGPANDHDQAQAVTVDSNGNVVVAGYSIGKSFSFDYYTAKYAAADGALLWEQRYNGPSSGHDYARAVASDVSGNVVVTGSSWRNDSHEDYYTAKYAAVDGALLWEQRYNGPANGDDLASSVALGVNGMVAIAGYSDGNFRFHFDDAVFDYAVVVYQENLPSISLQRVPTGVQLYFNGVAGRTYQVQRALMVTGPWTTIATPTASATGLIDYTDATALVGQSFYRVSTP